MTGQDVETLGGEIPEARLPGVSGIRILSDGTRDGTSVLVDGIELTGVTEVEWKINTHTRQATVMLHMRDVAMDLGQQVPVEVARALQVVQEWTQKQKEGSHAE